MGSARTPGEPLGASSAGDPDLAREGRSRPGAPPATLDREVVASILDLVMDLVAVPTQGGIDDCAPAFTLLAEWFRARGLMAETVWEDGVRVGLLVAVEGTDASRPALLLDAPIDTAGIGDRTAWTHEPLVPVVEDGWLTGRGAADCKAGVALLAHLLVELNRAAPLAAPVVAVFDAEEHTGTFTGIRRALGHPRLQAGVLGALIAYPGLDEIVVGGRGFLRATLTVHGRGEHSGSRRPAHANAVSRAAELIAELGAVREPAPASGAFPPGKVTVTGVRGGGEFSAVPSQCAVQVDVRLTPTFTAGDAEAVLGRVIARLGAPAGVAATTLELHEVQPAFHTPLSSPLVRALRRHADALLPEPPVPVVAGPSNIGNLLAPMGIDTVAGFGVRYRSLHGPDEAIDTTTIAPVFEVYRRAVLDMVM